MRHATIHLLLPSVDVELVVDTTPVMPSLHFPTASVDRWR